VITGERRGPPRLPNNGASPTWPTRTIRCVFSWRRSARAATCSRCSHSGSASLSTLSLGASLSANLGWSQTQDLATGSRTRFKSLSGKAGHPIPGLEGLSAEAAGGYSRADDDAGFLDTVQTSWSAGLQWKAGQGVLWSASYEGLRYEDAVNAGQSYDEGRATVKAVLAF